MKSLLSVTAIIALGWFASWIGIGSGGPNPVADCTRRGIAYFKEIEAYPRLSSGRLADEAARERCLRTTGAFP